MHFSTFSHLRLRTLQKRRQKDCKSQFAVRLFLLLVSETYLKSIFMTLHIAPYKFPMTQHTSFPLSSEQHWYLKWCHINFYLSSIWNAYEIKCIPFLVHLSPPSPRHSSYIRWPWLHCFKKWAVSLNLTLGGYFHLTHSCLNPAGFCSLCPHGPVASNPCGKRRLTRTHTKDQAHERVLSITGKKIQFK